MATSVDEIEAQNTCCRYRYYIHVDTIDIPPIV